MMSDRDLIVHLQKLVVMKEGIIGKRDDRISELEAIVRGQSVEYKRKYYELRGHFDDQAQRIIDYLLPTSGSFVFGEKIDEALRNRFGGSLGSFQRRCRELENEGVLIRKYEHEDGSGRPLYAINLQGKMEGEMKE